MIEYVGTPYESTSPSGGSGQVLHLSSYYRREGDLYSDTVVFNMVAIDPDGGDIEYNFIGEEGYAGSSSPSYMSNSETGMFSWTPKKPNVPGGESEKYYFTVLAIDDDGAYTEQQVVINVFNVDDKPHINAFLPAGEVGAEGNCELHTFVSINDPDTTYHDLTFSTSTSLEGATLTELSPGIWSLDWFYLSPVRWIYDIPEVQPLTFTATGISDTDDSALALEEMVSLLTANLRPIYMLVRPAAASRDRRVYGDVREDAPTGYDIFQEWTYNDSHSGWSIGTINGGPSHGTAVFENDGDLSPNAIITYVPNEGYVGLDHVSYHITSYSGHWIYPYGWFGPFDGIETFTGNTATIDVVVGNPGYEILSSEVLKGKSNVGDPTNCPCDCGCGPTTTTADDQHAGQPIADQAIHRRPHDLRSGATGVDAGGQAQAHGRIPARRPDRRVVDRRRHALVGRL